MKNQNFQDQDQKLLQLKRESFHVNIRKAKREEVFSLKRKFVVENGDTSTLDSIISLKEAQKQMLSMQNYVNRTNVVDQNDEQIRNLYFCIQFISMNMEISQSILDPNIIDFSFRLIDIILSTRKSFLRYDDSEEMIREAAIDSLVKLLQSFSYYRNDVVKHFEGKEEILMVLIISIRDINLLQSVLYLISNILLDDQSQIVNYLKRDIQVKVLNQLYELQGQVVIAEAVLSLMRDLSVRYDLFSSYQTKITLQYIQTIFTQADEINYFGCLQVIKNLTERINENGQRLHELFNQLIEYDIINRVIKLLLTQNSIYLKSGWQILMNLSQITLNQMIKYLIDDNLLLLLSCQINDLESIQIELFIVLANIFSSSIFIKQQIVAQGLVSRVVSAYEIQRYQRNYELIREVMHCIINAICGSSQDQLNYYFKNELSPCIIHYFLDFDSQLWDPDLIKELIDTIKYLCENCTQFLKFCQENHPFLVILNDLYKKNDDELNDDIEGLLQLLS